MYSVASLWSRGTWHFYIGVMWLGFGGESNEYQRFPPPPRPCTHARTDRGSNPIQLSSGNAAAIQPWVKGTNISLPQRVLQNHPPTTGCSTYQLAQLHKGWNVEQDLAQRRGPSHFKPPDTHIGLGQNRKTNNSKPLVSKLGLRESSFFSELGSFRWCPVTDSFIRNADFSIALELHYPEG